MSSENSWGEWSKYVLAEIKRAHTNIEKMEERARKRDIEIAMLQVKAGVWGAIAGLIPSTVAAIYIILKYIP